ASALADDAERLALFDGKGDAVHRFHDAAAGVKVSLKVFDLEYRHQSLAPFGSSASRNPSPRKFSEKSVSERAIAGAIKRRGAISIASTPFEISVPQDAIGG